MPTDAGSGVFTIFLSSFNGRVPNAANKKRTARRKLPDEIERVGTYVALEKRELVRRRFFVFEKTFFFKCVFCVRVCCVGLAFILFTFL